MSAASRQEIEEDDSLELAVAQAVAASNGDVRAAVRVLIAENRTLRRSVSHAFMRGRFRTYAG